MEPSLEALARRAFELAFFFHPYRGRALGIAERAIGKLRVAERAQVRRVYYRPKGRRLGRGVAAPGSRTKVSVERSQLLQRLVLHESELVEREQEAQVGLGALTDEEFTLRFVQHLVRSSSRRNSLYVAVGVGRILHSYGTAEVQDLLATVVQDPERVPEDSYLRYVKASLSRELADRFGALLRTRIGARGEESFEAVPPSPRLRRLVDDCLERLTPWNTGCAVPAGFDARTETLRLLHFTGEDPDDSHAIEVNRMHSLLHTNCFSRLTAALRLPSPAERLSVPRLFRSDDSPRGGGGSGIDRTSSPALTDDDLENLGSRLSREAGARATLRVERLMVRVDGIGRMKLDVREGAAARCELDEGAELVEVLGSTDRDDGSSADQTLLAIHWLRPTPWTPRGTDWDERWTVVLGGRRELRLSAGLGETDAETDATGGNLQRSRVVLVAECGMRSPATRLREQWLAWRWLILPPGERMGWIAAAAACLSAMATLAIWIARGAVDPQRRTEPVTLEAPASGGQTRGAAPAPRSTPLAAVRVIYLASPEEPGAEPVAALLRRELLASGRFQLTVDREQADLALKFQIRGEASASSGGSPVALGVELVDENGEALWSATVAAASWEEAVDRAITDLVQRAR